MGGGAGYQPVSTLSQIECKIYCKFLNLWADDFSDYYEEYSGDEMPQRRLRLRSRFLSDMNYTRQEIEFHDLSPQYLSMI